MNTRRMTVSESAPQMFITKDKQRLKQNQEKREIYLNNGDEFEIEIFNPTQFVVGALITLNGISTERKVILRPYERIFVERFLDNPKKFVFETYHVDNDKGTAEGIVHNGLVKVDFFKELKIKNDFVINNMTSPSQFNKTRAVTDAFDTFSLPCSLKDNTNDTINTPLNNSNSHRQSSALHRLSFNTEPNPQVLDNTIETGRVAEGSVSNQSFKRIDINLENKSFTTVTWKILPKSREVIYAEDLIVYCANCGRKKKPKENFCPKCGNKL